MTHVALRKESVDRNCGCCVKSRCWVLSLSARRAWIEMVVLCLACVLLLVALRKESVDRNFPGMNIILFIIASLSARRAWIEISRYAW